MDPFYELRKHANGNHEHKVKLNVVLSAITEVIYDQRRHSTSMLQDIHKPISNTEYFAALMTGLDSASSSHCTDLTQLLSMVLPVTSEAVLRSKFSAIIKTLLSVLSEIRKENHTKLEDTSSTALLRSICTCVGLVLLAQQPNSNTFHRPDAMKSFHFLLSCATDDRPKLRKIGQKYIVEILEVHFYAKCSALSSQILQFVSSVLSIATTQDEHRVTMLIGFLRLVFPYLYGEDIITKLVTTLINKKFLNSSVNVITVCTYDALCALSSSDIEPTQMTQDSLMKLISAILTSDVNSVLDPALGSNVVKILETCMVKLFNVNEKITRDFVTRVTAAICSHLESTQTKLQGKAIKSLYAIISSCLTPRDLQQCNVIVSLESLLSLRFQPAWLKICPFFADLFTFYGSSSSPLFDTILKKCVELHEVITTNSTKESGLTSTTTASTFLPVISAAISAIGPSQFLSIISIVHPTEVIHPNRLWLLPILKDAIRNPNCRDKCELSCFIRIFLPLARDCESNSQKCDLEGKTLQRKQFQMLTMQLWHLFPSFCSQANDIDVSFKKIAKILANGMSDKRYPELRMTVCRGLQCLIKVTRAPNAKSVEVMDDEETYEESGEYTAHVVDEAKRVRDANALAAYAGRYIPILITFVEELDSDKDADNCQVLLETIEGFSSLADTALRTSTFKKIMAKLLDATAKAQNTEVTEAKLKSLQRTAQTQMALAMTFVPHMESESVQLLYRVLKPYLIADQDPSMQKKSYSVLVAICDYHPNFIMSEENLTDMTQSICESLLTCSIPAKKARLQCLVHLITALQTTIENDPASASEKYLDDNLIPNLVGEIMLCTKEANGKAREVAFDLLVAMAWLMKTKDHENGLLTFLQMVLGGLAARTPHMRSAAVVCLSRLVFEFGRTDSVIYQAMPQLLQTVILLLHEKSREVIKSVIGFLKLGIAILDTEALKPFLSDILNGLLVWIGHSKNRFRAKTRVILMKLCKKYSYEYIAELVPDEDRALIRHIKKTKEREAKAKKDDKMNQVENSAGSFKEFMDGSDDEEDHDDADVDMNDEEEYEAALKRKKEHFKKSKSRNVIAEGDNDIVDLLDTNAVMKSIRDIDDADNDSDTDMEELAVAKDGRFIIPDDADRQEGTDDEKDDEESIKIDVAAQLEKMGLNKRKRDQDDNPIGKEYRSKKAGGDMKKKGKLEPYAYIPLDPRLMAKRNKRSAVAKYGKNIGKRRQGRK